MPKTSKRIDQNEIDWLVHRLDQHSALDSAQPIQRGTFRKVLWGYKTAFPGTPRSRKALAQTVTRIRNPNRESVSVLLAPMIRSARQRLHAGTLRMPQKQVVAKRTASPQPSVSGNGQVSTANLIQALQLQVADLTRRVGILEQAAPRLRHRAAQ